MINGGGGDNPIYSPTKSDFGGFISQPRIGMYIPKISKRETKPIEEYQITEEPN